ncbi:MAG: SBBP repeat-containing protein [Candidatus Heimdallarchaeota archaeon]|nr:MAG: SBBP repeat-containing protein [Candidatus Heimdallarchaeota archaeon]
MKNKKKLLIGKVVVILLLNISIVGCTSILNSRQDRQLQVEIEDFTYSTYLGGDDSPYSEDNIEEVIRDVTTDSQENIIITGNTLSSNFPVKNAFQDTFAGGGNDVHCVGGDAIIAKFDKDGQLLWSTFLGGNSMDGGICVKVVESDEIIVMGMTKSNDFPTTDNAYQKNYSSNYDIFITKLTSNGSIIYSSYLGESGDDTINSFELDSSGNLVVSGRTTSVDFPVTTSADQPVIGGGADGFFMCLSANYSTILYSTFLGGSDNEGINEITIDTQGNIIVTGTTMSSDFPITTDAYQSSISSTHSDNFIVKYNSSGQITYATYFGGSLSDYSFGLTTDSVGNIIIAGKTLSADFPTINAWKTNYSNSMVDAFVTKFSANGQELIFSSYFGGSGWDVVLNLKVDSNDNIIVTGYADIYPNAFPILDAFQEEIRGRCDIVIMKISPTGQPLFGTYLGGEGLDHPWSHYLASNYLYIVGFTESVDFFTTSNAYQQTIRGNHDGFLFRFDIDGYLTSLTSETMESDTTKSYTLTSETTESETTPSFEPHIVLIGLLSALGIGLRIRVKKE